MSFHNTSLSAESLLGAFLALAFCDDYDLREPCEPSRMKRLPRDPCELAESIRDALLGDECEQGSSSLMARGMRTSLFDPPRRCSRPRSSYPACYHAGYL